MNQGLSEETLARVRRILATFPAIDRAVLYGSRAMGTFKSGSDIDLTLFGKGIDRALCAEVAMMFGASIIPFRVDVSAFDLLTHEGLKDHIRRRGTVLFDRSVWDAEQAAIRLARLASEDAGAAGKGP